MTELRNCPAINKACEYYKCQTDIYGDIVLTFCNHPENPDDCEGNTTKQFCPKRNPKGTSKPINCPFCGLEPTVSEHAPKVDGNAQWMITCENSHCNFNPSAHGFVSSDYAIKAWNTRAEEWWRRQRGMIELKTNKLRSEVMLHEGQINGIIDLNLNPGLLLNSE